MKTMESNVARQYRIQQWAEQIKDCNSRPAELSVKDWCNQNAITPANYYYRLREVRKAYVLYNIGEYTSAPYKVIWKALASKGMEACVIGRKEGKLIIPDHNNVMIPFEEESEAHYVCAIINSRIVGKFIDSYISWFKSNHILDNINIPPYDVNNKSHNEISRLSMDAHSNAINGLNNDEIENQIEVLVTKVLLNE